MIIWNNINFCDTYKIHNIILLLIAIISNLGYDCLRTDGPGTRPSAFVSDSAVFECLLPDRFHGIFNDVLCTLHQEGVSESLDNRLLVGHKQRLFTKGPKRY